MKTPFNTPDKLLSKAKQLLGVPEGLSAHTRAQHLPGGKVSFENLLLSVIWNTGRAVPASWEANDMDRIIHPTAQPARRQ